MAGVSIDDFGASMIHYMPGVTPTLNNAVLLRQLMNQDYKWEGKNIQFFVHVARNQGVGYIEDGGAIPVPGKQDYVEATAYRRFLSGGVQVTDGVLATASTSEKAAEDVVTSELRGLVEGLAKMENFFGFRNGTGAVATIKAVTAASTSAVVQTNDARLIWDKVAYEHYDSTLTTLKGTFTVTSTARAPNASGYYLTTGNLSAATVDGDLLVWPGALNRAPTGLVKLIDDASTTFQNINTSTYPRYTSPVFDNSSTLRALTPQLFRQVMATAKQETGQKKDNEWTVICTNWQGIETEQLYEGELRITPDTKVGGVAIAGFNSAFGRINITTESDCPYNTMFFCDFSQIYRAVQKELDFARQGGGSIFRRNGSSTSWIADALEISEYFIKRRNTSAKIEDLSETSVTGY